MPARGGTLRACLTLIVLCAPGALAASAQAQPGPSPSIAATTVPTHAPSTSPSGLTGGSPAPVADPAITARAIDWLHRLQTATIDRAQLNDSVNSLLTDTLSKSVAAQFGPLGDPTAFTLVDRRTVAGSTVYMYRATFSSSSLFFVFALDRAGKVSGLRFLPAH